MKQQMERMLFQTSNSFMVSANDAYTYQINYDYSLTECTTFYYEIEKPEYRTVKSVIKLIHKDHHPYHLHDTNPLIFSPRVRVEGPIVCIKPPVPVCLDQGSVVSFHMSIFINQKDICDTCALTNQLLNTSYIAMTQYVVWMI